MKVIKITLILRSEGLETAIVVQNHNAHHATLSAL